MLMVIEMEMDNGSGRRYRSGDGSESGKIKMVLDMKLDPLSC